MAEVTVRQAVYLAAICLLFLLLPVCESFQWTGSLENDVYVSACVDGNISLPWDFTTLPGEITHDIRWIYHVPGTEELIASFVANNFFSSSAFSQRVQYLPNGGLVLSHLTVSDSGNYTVEVAVRDTHAISDYRKTAVIEVVAGLQVTQAPEAVYAPGTDSWHVTLSCGTVIGAHSGDVLWRTPSGDLPSTSTDTDNGHFFLRLPNPVQGGNYSCVVSPTAQSCSPSGSREVTLIVDETKARLTLVEAENKDLRKRVRALSHKASSLENTTNVLSSKTSSLEEKQTKCQENTTTNLYELNRCNETASRRVAFHARLSDEKQFNHPSPVILDVTVLNEGDAYSNTTGNFTVPYTGTYFLIATSKDGSTSTSDTGDVTIMADDTWLCHTYSKYENYHVIGTCHVTAHLDAGQHVWLRADHRNGYFDGSATAFSGFLLHAEE